MAIVGEGRHVTPELRHALRHARVQELESVTREVDSGLGGDREVAHAIAILVLSCVDAAAVSYRIDEDMQQVDRALQNFRHAIVRIVEPGVTTLQRR
ncbi:MAG: hypothetical protein VX246_03180 [Myxococcota bacterium]|nr:hypothetical protein [Myxococcota bacterium]